MNERGRGEILDVKKCEAMIQMQEWDVKFVYNSHT